MEITDVLGKLVSNGLQKVDEGETNLNLFTATTPTSGIYFVRVTIGTQQIVKKIVIE